MLEVGKKPIQSALNDYPVLYKGNGSALTEYNPFQELSQLFSLLSAEDTATTYQKAAEKTWLLFKKAIALLLFIVSLIIALPIWIGGIGFQAGFHFHRWLEVEQPPLEQIVFNLLEFLAWPFKQAYAWASQFIEEYLHWKVCFDQPDAKTSLPASVTPAPTTAIAPTNPPAAP